LRLEKLYGDKDIAPAKVTEKGKLKLNMVDYVNNMIKQFPEELSLNYPWNDNLLKGRSKQ
jgi:hypothetical protein